jgi:DNA-binding MarR family transcriptional regulator
MSEGSKLLRETMRRLERRIVMDEDHLKSCCGISLTQCHAMVEIGRAGSISVRSLSERMGLDNSTVSRAVDTLVAKGIAHRETDPSNRRFVTISLTRMGQTEFHGIESSMNVYYEKVLDTIAKEKREQVVESIQLLLQAVCEVGVGELDLNKSEEGLRQSGPEK